MAINILDNSHLKELQDLSEDTINMIKEKIGYKRYGVRINKFEPDPYNRVEYIYDAVGMRPMKINSNTRAMDYGDWSELWFIKENYPVMLNPDGTIHQYLNPNDYTKTIGGKDSDVANLDCEANVMSRIPLVYVHLSDDYKYIYMAVSKYKIDDTYIPLAHYREDGSVAEEVFLSSYICYLQNEKLRSISGLYPTRDINLYNASKYAQANGKGWNITTFGIYQLMTILLTIIGKSTDGVNIFGYGNTENSNYNDESLYYGMNPSGSMNDSGQFTGTTYTASAGMKVFHIESWWGDNTKSIDGIIVDPGGNIKVTLTGPYNESTEHYKKIWTQLDFSGSSTSVVNVRYLKSMKPTNYGIFPTLQSGGSYSTYYTDALWYKVPSDYEASFTFGGHTNSGTSTGQFAISFSPPYKSESAVMTSSACLSYTPQS